jgi:hypothetical protein
MQIYISRDFSQLLSKQGQRNYDWQKDQRWVEVADLLPHCFKACLLNSDLKTSTDQIMPSCKAD